MMAQSEVVVVGIDVAKDKVDACIRSLSQRQTFSSTAEGQRALIRWLRKHRVGKAAMEASGGYEQDWAKALREARIEVRIVDPKRVRSFARSAGRLAKNDPIDAEMIAWFAETFTEAPGQAYDAARERLVKIVNARQGLPSNICEINSIRSQQGSDLTEPISSLRLQESDRILVEIYASSNEVDCPSGLMSIPPSQYSRHWAVSHSTFKIWQDAIPFNADAVQYSCCEGGDLRCVSMVGTQ